MNTRSAHVVIGANFGDEGKGLLTDYFAAQLRTSGVVVRFNGGAQAGHTVVTPVGQRHVFGHVGAGSFHGAATFLSHFFVCNPILFLREHQMLVKLGVRPRVLVDPRAPITTPFDMMINQIVEDRRGAGRHGSCGVGFGETIERNLSAEFALTVADLADRPRLLDRLDAIRRRYLPGRLARLGIQDPGPEHREIALSDGLLEAFAFDTQCFLENIEVHDSAAIGSIGEVLFEGAQGLLLDQDRGSFPHVTRSNTGLRNVLSLAAEMAIGHLDVTYVTRAYLTRHGAGPMPNELGEPPYPQIVDRTNIAHPYQGALRFGLLDLDLLAASVATDLADALPTGISADAALAVTCLDQLAGEPLRYMQQGSEQQSSTEVFLARAVAATHARWHYSATGTTRDTVCRHMS